MSQTNSQNAPMELYAQKARLQLQGEQELLSAGMAGVVELVFTFSEEWQGLQKTAVFSNGTHSVDVPEAQWEENVCPIPQQVLAEAGKTVMVGLYGTDGLTQILPTIWCVLGRVEPGAAPVCNIAPAPQIPIWAQLQGQIAAVEAAVQSAYVKPADGIPPQDLSAQLLYRIGYLMVTLTKVGETYSADALPADIRSALDQGADVRLYDSSIGAWYPLLFSNALEAFFGGLQVDYSAGGLSITAFRITSSEVDWINTPVVIA